jgi:hypothetical protein
MADLTPTSLSNAAGISVPYASQILSGVRTPARRLAIRIYRKTGAKFPPIDSLSEQDIDLLERIEA